MKHSLHEDAAHYKDFYDSKKQGNGHVLSIYQSKASQAAKESFFEMSHTHWKNVGEFLAYLTDILPATGFLGGEVPGEADFHLAAWLARISAAGGGKKSDDGWKKLPNELGFESNVAKYWAAWAGRESWKQVYGESLH